MVGNRKDAELKSLTVGFAPQEQQGIVEANATIPPIWNEALQDALNRSLIFQDDAQIKINLSVRIVQFNSPEFGFDMVTKVGAIYEVVNRKNGDEARQYAEIENRKRHLAARHGLVVIDFVKTLK